MKLSPREAITNSKIDSLIRSDYGGKFSISVERGIVCLYETDKDGFHKWIEMPRKNFNRIIDWYNKKQNVKGAVRCRRK